MLPIDKFPEVPEGLEAEVNRLYSQCLPEGNGSFSAYFVSNTETYGISHEAASNLDRLLNSVRGTFEAIKVVDTRGVYKSEAPIDFIVPLETECEFAALGVLQGLLAPHDIVYGNSPEVVDFSLGLRRNITVPLDFFKSGIATIDAYITDRLKTNPTLSLDMPQGMPNITSKWLRSAALSALNDKLRFEAAVYEGLKARYGVTVGLPS